jgi:hypothetical protein
LKEYGVRNLKNKLWYEVYESVVTNWSELPAEQKSEKYMLILLFILLGIMLMMLIYWAEVYILLKNTEVLVIASKEIGLEVNVDKTKYMVMSGDQDAGRSHDIKIDNSSFERVQHFIYLGTNRTNQNSIQEVNKCRLKSQNACYHSVQNIVYKNCLFKSFY